MNASMSFQQIVASSLSTTGVTAATATVMDGILRWLFGGDSQRVRVCGWTSRKTQHKHLYWILISLNIFIALAYCDDDIIAPSTQSIPQKRSGGKLCAEKPDYLLVYGALFQYTYIFVLLFFFLCVLLVAIAVVAYCLAFPFIRSFVLRFLLIWSSAHWYSRTRG